MTACRWLWTIILAACGVMAAHEPEAHVAEAAYGTTWCAQSMCTDASITAQRVATTCRDETNAVKAFDSVNVTLWMPAGAHTTGPSLMPAFDHPANGAQVMEIAVERRELINGLAIYTDLKQLDVEVFDFKQTWSIRLASLELLRVTVGRRNSNAFSGRSIYHTFYYGIVLWSSAGTTAPSWSIACATSKRVCREIGYEMSTSCLQLLPHSPPSSPPSPSPSRPPPGEHELEQWAIITIGIMIPLGSALVALSASFLYRRRRLHGRARVEAQRYRRQEQALLSAVQALPSSCFSVGPPTTFLAHSSDAWNAREECSICLVPFEVGTLIKTLPCRHMFHADCIDSWLVGKRVVDGAPMQHEQGQVALPTIAPKVPLARSLCALSVHHARPCCGVSSCMPQATLPSAYSLHRCRAALCVR